ncbi:MAG: geranylgeranylglyceryl/heptaprenylglyceryl phosphate synthase [Bacteroidales bacterium]|nr:MAG: geranylgeranylglyceryl/heptaprenylglyceryl phosphate synthase [Bacteroidales bacterium]
MIYDSIVSKAGSCKQVALLIDPDKYDDHSLLRILHYANRTHTDFILVGGSLISDPVTPIIDRIKTNTTIPVVLFPGSLLQISDNADAILFLSLVSGRNPDYLIGNHIIAAPLLKKSNLEVISTAYLLIENGISTSVEYMSSTNPIPAEKVDIAVATALAAEMLGFKLIYLEAGSGAQCHVPEAMIREVRKNVGIPVIVGGGIREKEDARKIFRAGADIIVIGNAIEKDPLKLEEIASLRSSDTM